MFFWYNCWCWLPSFYPLFCFSIHQYVCLCLVYVFYRCLRFVHFLGTCEKRTAAQCQIPIFSAGETRFFRKSPLRSGSLFASTQKVHRPRSQSLLHLDIRDIWQIRSEKYVSSARRLLSAALLERWPQVCRVKLEITFTVLPMNRSVSTAKKSIKCVVNWILLRIHVRVKNKKIKVPNPTSKLVSPRNRATSGRIGHFQTFKV